MKFITKDTREAIQVFDRLVWKACLMPRPSNGMESDSILPGQLVASLPEDDRQKLQHLKSEDVKYEYFGC